MTAVPTPPSDPALPAAAPDPSAPRLPDPVEAALAKLIRDAGDSLHPDPAADPEVEVALAGVRAALRPSLLPAEMTPAVAEVLGLPNFRTGPIAHVYRAAGHAIRPKMEAEQAFVLFRFLGLALRHGPGWHAASCADLDAAAAAIAARKAKEETHG